MTVWADARRARQQAILRRGERAEAAAETITATLLERRTLRRQDIYRSRLPELELCKAEDRP